MKRDKDGLVVEGIEYKYDETGLIDWRAMVPDKFFVVKRESKNKDKNLLNDSDRLLLLGGIKYIAFLRGYTSVEYTLTIPTPQYVASTCSITWIPNIETENREVKFTSCSDAHPQNIEGYGVKYLTPTSENRSFCRCVRNFLRINVCSQDETTEQIDLETLNTVRGPNPHQNLELLMKQTGKDLNAIKRFLLKQGKKEAEVYNSIRDISVPDTFILAEALKRQLAGGAKA